MCLYIFEYATSRRPSFCMNDKFPSPSNPRKISPLPAMDLISKTDAGKYYAQLHFSNHLLCCIVDLASLRLAISEAAACVAKHKYLRKNSGKLARFEHGNHAKLPFFRGANRCSGCLRPGGRKSQRLHIGTRRPTRVSLKIYFEVFDGH